MMRTHLVLFACPGMPSPDVAEAYRAALASCGDVRLVWIAKPGRSGVFTRIGVSCRDVDGRVLPRLLERYAPGGPWRSVSLITFSAGYGLARELLRDPRDRAELAAYVALDSVHGPKDATALASVPFAAYAERAAESQALFWLSHTDVPTRGYLSTTELAAHLSSRVPLGGGWAVRSYDTAPPDKPRREHGAALVSWGPAFVGDALGPYLPTVGREGPSNAVSGDEPPDTLPTGADALRAHDGPARARTYRTLAGAVAAAALADLRAGVCEDLGRNDGRRIREYAAALGLRPPLNWCAVGTSAWLREGAAASGIPCPVDGSAGARALLSQFRAAGRFVAARDIEPAAHLIPGNVIGWKRGDVNDPNEWRGHVGIVARPVDRMVVATIEPNSGPRGDRVAETPWVVPGGSRVTRRLDDPRLIGIGLCTTFEEALGAGPPNEHEPSEHELAEAARLMRLGAELIADGEPDDPLGDLIARIG